MPEVKPGKYIHYKGGLYQVFGEGHNTETDEKFVVYKPLYPVPDPENFALRPKEMFIEEVEIKSDKVPSHLMPRFQFATEEVVVRVVENIIEQLSQSMRDKKVTLNQFYGACLSYGQHLKDREVAARLGLTEAAVATNRGLVGKYLNFDYLYKANSEF